MTTSQMRTSLLSLVAPVLIMVLWAHSYPIFADFGSLAESIFFWSGPTLSLAVGLTGIATADWRRFTRVAVVPIYIAAFLVALPFVVGGALCVTSGCPTV